MPQEQRQAYISLRSGDILKPGDRVLTSNEYGEQYFYTVKEGDGIAGISVNSWDLGYLRPVPGLMVDVP
jgi:hypothetical protein